MKVKPLPDRHQFANAWDEIGYLRDKLLYWLYQRKDADKARPYAERLEELLPKADPDQEAILAQECWSLLSETKGDLQKAIAHREKEVRLIRRLHQLSRDRPYQDLMLKDYGYDDLSDRLDLLAVLYHDSSQLDKALRALHESKQLCQKHGAAFDGEDLLREYLEEKESKQRQAESELRSKLSIRKTI